jgi:tRNA nucleotidyltransferase (CCA-adding enzyme)
MPAYLVGGTPRDLMLGRELRADLDLVVEGDATHLAQALAKSAGGRVLGHAKFGTAKWYVRGRQLDLVSARSETYARPGALPDVGPGTLQDDLRRRDFSINTLAIDVAPDRWGRLLDLHAGLDDLASGHIRPLYDDSFADDPTRLIRAVRLEQRLGFVIRPAVEELMARGRPILASISGQRRRDQLLAVFEELEPEPVLLRLEQLGILRSVHPGLTLKPDVIRSLRQLRQCLPEWPDHHPHARPSDYMAVWLSELPGPSQQSVMRELHLSRAQQRLTSGLHHLRQLETHLANASPTPSRIDQLLAATSAHAQRLAFCVFEQTTARQQLVAYHTIYRHVRPELDGHALRGLGLTPGPDYARILAELRSARLDGRVKSRREEEGLARRLAGLPTPREARQAGQ